MLLLVDNNIGGGISSVMGDKYVKSDENKKILFLDATKLYRHSMIQPLPYDELELWHADPDLYINKLDEILKTPDHCDIGYFVGVDLNYSDNIKEKTKNFPFAPENKIILEDKYNHCMKKKHNLRFVKNLKN